MTDENDFGTDAVISPVLSAFCGDAQDKTAKIGVLTDQSGL
jgi:hypothetical protein